MNPPGLPDELLQEIKALRADIQALPERITSALGKRLERTISVIGVWLMVAGLIYFVASWFRKL